MTACSSDRSEEHALSAPKPGRSEEHALPRPPSVPLPPGAEWPTETRGFLFISVGILPKLSISQEIDSFGGTCDCNRGCLVPASRGRITPSASSADVVMLTMPPLPPPFGAEWPSDGAAMPPLPTPSGAEWPSDGAASHEKGGGGPKLTIPIALKVTKSV